MYTAVVERKLVSSVTHMEENRARSRGFLHFPTVFLVWWLGHFYYTWERSQRRKSLSAYTQSFFVHLSLRARVHNRKRRSVFHDFFVVSTRKKPHSKDFRELNDNIWRRKVSFMLATSPWVHFCTRKYVTE